MTSTCTAVYPKDVDQHGVTYRWTGERSFVRLVGTRPDADTVTLRLSNGGRPAAAGTASVRVFLDDRPLGTITCLGDQFRDYDLAIPPDLARRIAARPTASELRLETDPWIPRDVLGIPDPRALGVMLARVEVSLSRRRRRCQFGCSTTCRSTTAVSAASSAAQTLP